ncbi:hypothetical protein ES708_03761 [subsurface metagenome]
MPEIAPATHSMAPFIRSFMPTISMITCIIVTSIASNHTSTNEGMISGTTIILGTPKGSFCITWDAIRAMVAPPKATMPSNSPSEKSSKTFCLAPLVIASITAARSLELLRCSISSPARLAISAGVTAASKGWVSPVLRSIMIPL